MNVTYRCPFCGTATRCDLQDATPELRCRACDAALPVPADAIHDGRLRRCVACPSTDLFIRKDFSQRLGVSIVVAGFAASSVAWFFYWIYTAFALLFATALVDVVLYLLVGEALVCYRCGAHYRSVAELGDHGPFRLETHERYRQQAARTGGNPVGSRP
jgi:hypothetical protein